MDNPRLLLLIALSFLAMMIWQAWVQDYGPKPQPTESTTQQAPAGVTSGAAPAPTQDLPAAGTATSAPSVSASQALESGQRISVETDLLHGEIDTRGGDLRVLDMLAYPESTKPDSAPFRLLNDQGKEVFVVQSGVRTGTTEEPTHHAVFKASQTDFHLADGADTLDVPLYWDNGAGVTLVKTYHFERGSYVVRVDMAIDNKSADSLSVRRYDQLQRSEPEKPSGHSAVASRVYTGGVIYSPQDKYQKIAFTDMKKSDLGRDVQGGWAAMVQHYFFAAWIPPADDAEHFYSRALDDNRYVLGMIGPQTTVASGQQSTMTMRLYAGPKLQDKLAAVAPGLELTVDYGRLTFLSQPLFWLLEKIHGIVGNWGWSIVLLTLLIKLAFFKLSETSYKSMANMRKLAPRMQALKERYGDDKQRLNQAMMEMYKTEKINPLGGCLPIVVQIPVFIALYWVLLESVELRQAPFVFWLKDLSSADPYFVLPLIMGVTMLIQQKLNPAPMDPVQAKVMMVLPVVFTVFFAFFPAGLVLYWVVNNVLSIAQQWVITRRVEAAAR